MDKLEKLFYQFLLETNMSISKPFAKKSKSKLKKKKNVLEKGLYNISVLIMIIQGEKKK